ncbi:MAG: hypothetical protein KatS3mg095_0240 [Candidatus Parcubacteria bacterium]|nr:MAG: hypothetical protein KatS3mg095_0240 [Candidatus Parcubacteria bacterium]
MVRVIFLIGKPACGKDTQADLLVKNLKFKKITTSEELDIFLKKYNKKYFHLGKIKINIDKQIKNKNKGKLVAYRLVSWLVNKLIIENIKKGNSIVFAGSPRSLFEAKNALKILNKLNIKYQFIYLKTSDQTIIKRMFKRAKIKKRVDDNLRIIKERLKIFKKEVIPMINYLKSKKVLKIINGEVSINQVYKRLVKYIIGN